MSSIWNNGLSISIFGESHGSTIGVVLDKIPAGYDINFNDIIKFMSKRKSNINKEISTKRLETDIPEILSGIYNNKTTGTPIAAIIKNIDIKGNDYDEISSVFRPGHADFPLHFKHKGFNNKSGGGHSSGRLTAPFVFAGAIANQILKTYKIYSASHIISIKTIKDISFNTENLKKKNIDILDKKTFPIIDDSIKQSMIDQILLAKSEKDSVGGIIETAIIGVPVGLGNPIFNGIQANIASLVMSIPSTKGIEFGNGFESTKIYGSKNNDEYYIDNNMIKSFSNNHGGILGGVSTGMPIVFKTAIKPTSSISKVQRSINFKTMKNEKIKISGRHDPCIVPRANIVIQSCANISILSYILR
ncbi:MAG: chorismate synthase [Oscillospiraceae bacterium]|nr:chorismate synthase [Oscillospiraceae bacterium]